MSPTPSTFRTSSRSPRGRRLAAHHRQAARRPALHRAALAYASDYMLLEPVLRAHGKTVHPGLSVASLDHAMWWHRDFRADEWLLYVLHSPSASSARGLGTGQFFNREGTLVATVAQEGMVRLPEDSL